TVIESLLLSNREDLNNQALPQVVLPRMQSWLCISYQIFIVNSIVLYTWLMLYKGNLKSAFDSVDREALWKALRGIGTPTLILIPIKDLYSSTHSKIRLSTNLSDP